MKVITDKELDNTTFQIKCGENYGTAFLINENTAITVKHCLYNNKEKKYETNAVLLVYINNEEKKINVIVDKLFDNRFDELVVLHCEEKINVPTLCLAYADICMFEGLKAIGFGKSYERKKRWIKLQNSNFLNDGISENMILDIQNSKAIDYRGFSGALIADTYNYVVGVIKSQLNESGKANALLGISLKNQLAFCKKYNLQIQNREKALGDHFEKARITDFRDGINQNAYFKNKQYENIAISTNSKAETEDTKFSEETANPDCKKLSWNIKYTSVEGFFCPYCVTKGMKKAAFLFFRVEVRNAACAVQYLVVVQTMLVRCPKNLDFTMFQKVSLSNLIF